MLQDTLPEYAESPSFRAGRMSIELGVSLPSTSVLDMPDIRYQRHAPHTGAPQCGLCGGWIISASSFWREYLLPQGESALTSSVQYVRMCAGCAQK